MLNSIPEPNSGCWLWLGHTNKDGYGRLGHDKLERQAHRLSYATFRGPVSPEIKVLHHCDVPCCVNPDHLFLGTLSDNVQDCLTKGRHVARFGDDHPHAKLSQTIVADIRSREIRYGSISSMAREFGVSRAAIRQALGGDTWSK